MILNYQIYYYSKYRNWKLWAKYKNKKIKSDPPQAGGLNIYFELNTYGAWDAFKFCNERRVLCKALKWIDLAIKLDKDNWADYFDTKANLLYKIGQTAKAISYQEKAISLKPNKKDFRQVLEKMKKGDPTYLEDGALWLKKGK
jgi:tetratricopeptide (TPR) repeat protein